MKYVRLLTIAGSDSGGGAGIQADLKTFSALGGYGMSVITAITAQNTVGVSAIHEVPPDMVSAQLDAVISDIGVDAVKIGMLASPAIVAAVAERLRHFQVSPVVLDPVMVATSGHRLLRDEAIELMKKELIPLASIITPNLPEAALLLGTPVVSISDAQKAAAALLQFGCRAALVKGGHFDGEHSDDVLAIQTEAGVEICHIEGARIHTRNTHGTGCTLSSAIAAFMGRGWPVREAVREAKQYLAGALAAGASFQVGHGHGPLCHGFEPVSTMVVEK